MQSAVNLTTGSGATLRLRPASDADRGALEEGFARLSAESRQQRFFTAMPALPQVVADRLVDIDQKRHIAWAAFDPLRDGIVDRRQPLGVGVVHVFRAQDHSSGEIAVTVIDAYQRQGIGTLLLGVGAVAATATGIRELTAAVLATNTGMLQLLRRLGGFTKRSLEDRTVIDVDLDPARLASSLPLEVADHVHLVALGMSRDPAAT
jgi:RimJ/RimL family protein N-acetyltransferase